MRIILERTMNRGKGSVKALPSTPSTFGEKSKSIVSKTRTPALDLGTHEIA